MAVWTLVDYLIIRHPDPHDSRVLYGGTTGSQAFPQITTQVPDTTATLIPQDVAALQRACSAQFGGAWTILQCAGTAQDEHAHLLARWYEIECQSNLCIPPGFSWIDLDTAAADELPAPVVHRLTSVSRLAWQQHGWFTIASRWCRDVCTAQGVTVAGPIEQLRTWHRACVLRIPITRGLLYFKAVPPCFAAEPGITAALAQVLPEAATQPFALHPEHPWMLLYDIGGQPLATRTDIAAWVAAVQTYARLQRASVRSGEVLIQSGCPQLDLPLLLERAAALFATWSPGDRMAESDYRYVVNLYPALCEAAAKLAAYNLPLTIEHGDFEPHNVMWRPKGACVFDWSDASFSHPFFSLHPGFIPDLPTSETIAEQLLAAYLGVWADIAPPAELREAYRLAQQLMPLQMAVRYYQMLPQCVTDQERIDVASRIIGPLYGLRHGYAAQA